MPRWRVYPRHRLDLRPRHLLVAAGACAWARDAGARERALAHAAGEDAIVCFSVRSAFELLLEALALPAGSELVFSAITHPDMAHIARRHGLVPVPVDIDPDSLAPPAELVERALTPHTRALVVAHLFGSRVDLEPLVSLARGRRLLLVEDCAQAFRGPGDRGDPRADATLFSFGSIKTCPALGGALLYVRDPDLHARARGVQASWPRQPRGEFLARTVRFAGLLTLAHPLVYGSFVRGGRRLGLDVDALVNGSVRGLRPPAPGDDAAFEAWLRRRPSAPLLALLGHRLRTFARGRLRARAARGDAVARRLPAGLSHPGGEAREHTHWVFPVLTPRPPGLVASLLAAGFDATRATTSIAALDPPADRPEQRPRAAEELMSRVVFLPVYPELPDAALDRLLAAAAAAVDGGDDA